MANDLAKFIPMNPVEHENELRGIILKHMGTGSGNPTQWVVDACREAYNAGFGLGFKTGMLAKAAGPAPAPSFRVVPPPGVELDHDAVRAIGGEPRRISGPPKGDTFDG